VETRLLKSAVDKLLTERRVCSVGVQYYAMSVVQITARITAGLRRAGERESRRAGSGGRQGRIEFASGC
jgi:hypothetical protein